MTRNDMTRTDYDVLIVGGGMVGLAMAASLCDSSLKIGVLERQDFSSVDQPSLLTEQQVAANDYDIRVSAINPANQAFLSSFDVWQKIPSCRLANYEKMFVWDALGQGKIEFDAAKLGRAFLGTIVENRVLRAALYQRLMNTSNVTLLTNHSIDQIINLAASTNNESVTVALANGEQIKCRFLIGADGANSLVRQQLIIGNSSQPYEQSAYVVNVQCELPHQNTAWQRFTEFGPVAFLPLPDEKLCSIVWSIDTVQANALKLKNLTASAFAEKLASFFESRLGQLEIISPIQNFPLISQHSETYLTRRCALIGDAAHTIHPLAGQGVNLGLQDALSLSQQIKAQLSAGRDFTNIANLRAFERIRKQQNYLMQASMSGFKWLFGSNQMPVVLLRNSLLTQMNQLELVKQQFISHAMGI
ncbi:UbiH/UbiF/VisC/COQ6 family ubiquinone biosynthesis hydroxylase [Aliikangiella maris]|uniref:UbiH/UbiF/VisC/COQ6 family ubiquinone biosynthesis hydroxylase n=2 Tax=Aliikangiella maris TaxID=3162458 RepID=A0ABV2BX72_9GAMM